MVEIAPTPVEAQSAGSTSPGADRALGGVGLEIVTLADLPDAENYSDHEFYFENFSPSEIAYAGRQPSAKACFGGLLAAKKALVKAGAANGPFEGLRGVEIHCDAEGKPTYPSSLLSISSSGAFAAAVALQVGPAAALGAMAAGLKPKVGKRRPDFYIGLVVASMLFLFGYGLWLILRLALHKHP